MIENILELIQAFANNHHIIVRHDFQRAPHMPHALPRGCGAVYVFSLANGVVLKIGRAGLKSTTWFQSHHYQPNRANSTLVGKILADQDFREEHGITVSNIDHWLKSNCDRDNVYVPAEFKHLLPALEGWLIGRLRPR